MQKPESHFFWDIEIWCLNSFDFGKSLECLLCSILAKHCETYWDQNNMIAELCSFYYILQSDFWN